MKFSNIWKAYLSSFIGAVIPIITAIASDAITGTINWTAVKASLAPAVVLFITDLLNEAKNELNQ